MAALHSALQALGPCKFEDIPKSQHELEAYLQDLFKQSQLILESIPIPPSDEKLETRPRSNTTTSSIASNASEISSSSARPAPPIPEHAALQTEWGKPVKLSAKNNPLNMAVYRMGGRDGKGAWFARRSVQEGLGFAKFKRSLEREFPESLAVQGAPGEGNVRGIGGDKRVEDISVPGKGRVEVFQLSAQFPGPTTPRDFVTLLVTSANATEQNDDSGRPDLSPRHYMIISKPCDHPETQPRDGFVRGNYESVEFIREVPRLPKKTMSNLDLRKLDVDEGSALGREAMDLRSSKKEINLLPTNHENKSMNDLSAAIKASEETNRRRGKTISYSESKADDLRAHNKEGGDRYNPELNPVEWIMVTRSDPGGSVPRFMVERGTPGSIVADASKFLDWACQNENIDDLQNDRFGQHRDSFASYEANGHLAGINGDTTNDETTADDRPLTTPSVSHSQPEPASQSGILSNLTGAFSAGLESYAPQLVLDRLPGHTPQGSVAGNSTTTTLNLEADDNDNNSFDSLSTMSFASADSHLEDDNDNSNPKSSNPPHPDHHLSPSTTKSSRNTKEKTSSKKPQLTPHDKQLQKLDARRAALDAKLASTRSKSAKDAQTHTAKEREAIRKAEEKHAREMGKREEKYRREIEKIEARKRREEEKGRKREMMEEEERKKREDGEGRGLKGKRGEEVVLEGEVERLKREMRDVWTKQVEGLQRENEGLIGRVERLEEEVRELRGQLAGIGGSDGIPVVVVDANNIKEVSGKGKGKATNPTLQPAAAAVMGKDAAQNLLLKEEGLGPKGGQGKMLLRGVSFGNAGSSPNASSGDISGADSASAKSVRSRSSSILKRGVAVVVGIGGGEKGNGGGKAKEGVENGKGASS